MREHERAREIGERLGEMDERVGKCADCGRDMTKAEGSRIFTVCGLCWPPWHISDSKPLEKFMRAVARSVKCLPSYASPDPEDGNAHIIKALADRQQAMQGLADALKGMMPWTMRDRSSCGCPAGEREDDPKGKMPTLHSSACQDARAALDAAKPFLPASK